MMNEFTLFFLAFYITIFSVHVKQIKLLALENSFSADAIEYYLYGLAEANGDNIRISYPGTNPIASTTALAAA